MGRLAKLKMSRLVFGATWHQGMLPDLVAWCVEIAIPRDKTGMKLAHFIDVDDPARSWTILCTQLRQDFGILFPCHTKAGCVNTL